MKTPMIKQLTTKLPKTFTLSLLMSLASVNLASAAIDVYEFDSEQKEAQYRGLIEEFRCPKCQNQNLAGSDAPIAQDLKQKTYEMVQAGQSDAQIREYMYDRYGDFISYKPPVRPSTWILWFFPPLLLLLLIAGWIWRTKRQSKAALSATAANQTSQQQVFSDNTSTSDLDLSKENLGDDFVQTSNADNLQAGSKLTDQEQQALADLLAKHDDGSVSTADQINKNMPKKGDK